jgi:hypothetical protein
MLRTNKIPTGPGLVRSTQSQMYTCQNNYECLPSHFKLALICLMFIVLMVWFLITIHI